MLSTRLTRVKRLVKSFKNENEARTTPVAPGTIRYDSTLFRQQKVVLHIL
jgi:hypothetical protein